MEYLVVKWVHIVSSTFLFGTGIGSAFYLLVASLGRDARVVAATASTVVVADWLFTATTMVVQPATGFYLVHLARLPLATPWIAWSIVFYLIALACWLPVVVLQMRMRDHAKAAANEDRELPTEYWRYFRYWVALGIPALLSFLAIFYWMTTKHIFPFST